MRIISRGKLMLSAHGAGSSGARKAGSEPPVLAFARTLLAGRIPLATCGRLPMINRDYPMLDEADLVECTVRHREELQ
jgi:hypothetical protein